MRTYVIYGEKAFAEQASGGAVAGRTGFCVAALIFGPLYFVAAGAWLPFAIGVAAVAIDFAAAAFDVLGAGAAFALFALGNLYLAFEARHWAAWSQARKGRPIVDVVLAHSGIEAEKLYIERAAPESAAASAPAARRLGEVIGHFPEPGR